MKIRALPTQTPPPQTGARVLAQGLPNPAASNAGGVIRPVNRTIAGAQQAVNAAVSARNGGARGPQPVVRANTGLTIATLPGPIYGCTGIFDPCGDGDLASLSYQGNEAFLDWLGWQGTDICEIRRDFIAWQRPEQDDDENTPGWVSDPCGDAAGVEWGACDFTLSNFARLRRHTPTRDMTQIGLNRCVTSPRYRLDGTPITDDVEYDMNIVLAEVLSDLKKMVVNGNKVTAGQFSGLETLINNNYHSSNGVRCQLMDSNVINWNNNDMNGGAGITWNSVAQPTDAGLIAFLYAIVRLTRQRIKWSGQLQNQPLQIGDIAIVAPTRLAGCILDAYTCFTVCEGGAFTQVNINNQDSRDFRDKLNGGLYAAGEIFIDGLTIPIIAYDWELMKTATKNDMYVLTRKVGSVRTIEGQYNNLAKAQDKYPVDYAVTDGGRLLTWEEYLRTCLERFVEMQPRLLMPAPYLQTRIQNVNCTTLGPNIGPDPSTSFFPQKSFNVAGS